MWSMPDQPEASLGTCIDSGPFDLTPPTNRACSRTIEATRFPPGQADDLEPILVEVMVVVQMAMLAGMPYTKLANVVLAHPTMVRHAPCERAAPVRSARLTGKSGVDRTVANSEASLKLR
jgi:hypothetical protein